MIKSRNQILVWAFAIIAICLGVWCGFKSHQKKWIYDHPLSDPKWSFQFYMPQKLPQGIHITDSRISVFEEADEIYSVSAELNFRTEDWVYSVGEYRSNGQSETTGLKDFDINSVTPTCAQRATKLNQSYRLCHWLDYGRISVYEIKFAKGNAAIDSRFPTKKGHVISMSELDTYVDSFKKMDPPKKIVRGI